MISRIFWDLGIMRTRFVSPILGYALLEDLALWVVLAFATAIATSAKLAQQHVISTVSSHVISTLIFTLIGLLVAPGLLKRLSNANSNVLYKASPVGYAMAVLMTYCAIAAIFDVNLQFAALLAGYGIVGGLYGTQRDASPHRSTPSPKSPLVFSCPFTLESSAIGWCSDGSSLSRFCWCFW